MVVQVSEKHQQKHDPYRRMHKLLSAKLNQTSLERRAYKQTSNKLVWKTNVS